MQKMKENRGEAKSIRVHSFIQYLNRLLNPFASVGVAYQADDWSIFLFYFIVYHQMDLDFQVSIHYDKKKITQSQL